MKVQSLLDRQNPAAKTKRLHIEVLRIFAMLLVLFNHTGGAGYFLYASHQDSALFPLYIFLSVFTAVDIPLFFMISGGLLLGKEESIGDVYKKRVLRFVILLLVVSGCYYVYYGVAGGKPMSWGGFWRTVYSSNATVSLWYLYSYIGLLVMLPLLRKLVRGMEEKDYFYLFICYFVLTGVIPVAEYLLGRGAVELNGSFSASLVTSYSLFYFIMGYYWEKVAAENRFSGKNLLLGGVLSLAAIGVSCYMTMFKAGVTGELNEAVSQDFYGRLIAIPTFTVYAAAKAAFAHFQPGPKVRKVIAALGSATFGVYLLQGMLLGRMEFVFWRLEPVIKTLPACFAWVLATFCVGTVITLVLKKIPVIKNYI